MSLNLDGWLRRAVFRDCDYLRLSLYGSRHAKMYPRVNEYSEGNRSACLSTGWSVPSLSTYSFIGYYRIYKWRTIARILLCAGWTEYSYFARVWRHFFAWCGPYFVISIYIADSCIKYWTHRKDYNYEIQLCFSLWLHAGGLGLRLCDGSGLKTFK